MAKKKSLLFPKEKKPYFDKSGYLYIPVTKDVDVKYHPMCVRGYIAAHRYEMAKKLGKPITREHEVHHVDRDRTNNHISNLELVNRMDHIKEHIQKGEWKLFSPDYQPHLGRFPKTAGMLTPMRDHFLKNMASAQVNFPKTMKKITSGVSEVGGGLLENHTDVPHELVKGVGIQALGLAGRMKNKFQKAASEVSMGMKVELEHKDVTGGDKKLTRKIVNAHLKELPDYYTRLKKMEKGADIQDHIYDSNYEKLVKKHIEKKASIRTVDDLLKRHMAQHHQNLKLKNKHNLFNDLGFDDLDHVETMMDIENHHNLNISDDDMEKLNTVGSIKSYIKKNSKLKKTASIIDKMIEERRFPSKYVQDVTKITNMSSKDLEPYVVNLKPHKYNVSAEDFAKDIKSLHSYKTMHDGMKNEGLSGNKKHNKNMTIMMRKWIDSHNELSTRYSGVENPELVTIKTKFEDKLKNERKEKREMNKLIKNAGLSEKNDNSKIASRAGYILGGGLLGGVLPEAIHYLQNKKDLSPDQKREDIRRRIRNSLIGMGVGGTLGNLTSAVKKVSTTEHKPEFKQTWDGIDKNKILGSSLLYAGIGAVPGSIGYLKAKTDEDRSRAKQSITRGVLLGGGLKAINRFSNAFQK